MSVNRGSGRGVEELDQIDTFGDLESQVMTGLVVLDLENVNGPNLADDDQTNLAVANQPIANNRADPDTEVVELVAAEHLNSRFQHEYRQGTVEAEPGSAWMDYEAFWDDEAVGMDIERRDPIEEEPSAVGNGTDYSQSISNASTQIRYEGSQTLLWDGLGVTKAHQNSGNSAGGGGDSVDTRGWYINKYRDQTGFGPLVPPESRIQIGTVWDWSNVDNGKLVFRYAFRFWYDIWEVEPQEPLTLIDRD